MEEHVETKDARTPWPAVMALCLAVVGFYWFMASRSTLWDRDEPRFSRATAEMIESGNYLYPTFNGQLRPDKPILTYWLMSVPMRVLGPTSLACRFFSTVGIAVTCIFTFLLGRRFLGVKAGLWSMAVLASTLLIMVEGTAATADGILLPCMVAVIVLFSRDLVRPPGDAEARFVERRTSDGTSRAIGSRFTLLGMGLAFGLGLLAKGPVALLPIVVMVVTLVLMRRSEIRLGSHLGRLGGAAVLGCLLFLAWALPANNATGGEFMRLGIGHHVVARSARPLESHGGRFLLYLPYYLPVIIAGFFPWTLHLPGSISAVVNRRVGTAPFRALFLAWVVSIVVIMTLVATKLPHYILFTWPAMALAVGGTLAAASEGRLTETDRRWLRGGVWFFGPVAGGAVAGLCAAPLALHLTGAIVPFWISAAVLLGMSVLSIRRQLQNRPQASAVTLLVGMPVLLLPMMLGIMPALENVKISPGLAEAVKQQTSQEVPVATFGYAEPTLNFYIGRRIEPLADKEAVVAWARRPQPGVLIIPKALLAEVEQHSGTLDLTEIAARKGLNYSKGDALEVAALLRRERQP
ncbi:MAG: glycosyltransferase family 39 protein [Planctomycetes bacterium]|nr:glycosyltransferase family 39 protein [Planctomycetota bacterium]